MRETRVNVPTWMRLGLLILILAGCEAPPPSDAGRENRVRNSAPTPEQILHADEVLRIGTVEGAGPDAFGSVTFVGVGRNGLLYVVDGMAQEIRVFDQSGDYIRTFGRKGDGPGEFEGLTGLAFDPGGPILAMDVRAQRITTFDSAGTFVGTIHREWRFAFSTWPGRIAADGTLLDLARGLENLDQTIMAPQTFTTTITPIRFSRDLELLDSFPRVAWTRTAYGGNFAVPFEATTLFAFEASGDAWIADAAGYELVRRDAGGDTVLVATMEFEPVPVTDADRDSLVSDYEMVGALEQLDIGLVPKTKSTLVGLFAMGEGWVGVFPRLPHAVPGRFFDVFAPDGLHKGRFDLGLVLELRPTPTFRDGVIYGVHRDEFDVPFVVGLQLGVGPGGNGK